MTVSGGNAVQNSAYRSGITCGPQVREDLGAFNFGMQRLFESRFPISVICVNQW